MYRPQQVLCQQDASLLPPPLPHPHLIQTPLQQQGGVASAMGVMHV